MPLIFVVDPLLERRDVVQRTLEQVAYGVDVFATIHGALEMAGEKLPSLIIVALKLPDGNGMSLREQVRRHPTLSSIPVVLLTDSRIGGSPAINEWQDCIVFPFAPGELVNAVEGLLQRSSEVTSGDSSSEAAHIVIDPFAMKITVQGREITTTMLEFRLLDYLARHQGKTFTRDALLDAVWGDLSFVTPRSVDACIRRIRKKIEPAASSPRFLKTVRGTGYKLDAKPTWEVAGGACQCTICAGIRSRASTVQSRDSFKDRRAEAISLH
jgi:two-component system phosphate regulon response regulator PhoB